MDVFEKIERPAALTSAGRTAPAPKCTQGVSHSSGAEVRATGLKLLRCESPLVEYEAIQKWNGELPQYMMGSSTPFINLGAKKD